MGHLRHFRTREQLDQYALCDVVRVSLLLQRTTFAHVFRRHASIDAKTRKERGLPEDLIRLCVGIEDASDLLDDLEHALYDAGAISLNAAQNKFVRTPLPDSPEAEAEAEKLADEDEETEWFVSSPGKVILFGEHAVVHGVVCLFDSHPWYDDS